MAVREAPPAGLLASFSAPLWERLGLTELQPEWIVKGEHRGYDWMVIELTHQATGLFTSSDRASDTTTVFVLQLPHRSKNWHLPADRITSSRQLCVDDGCVYLAALGQQPRVRDWRRWLDMAADTADELVQSEGTHPAKVTTGASAPGGNSDDAEPEPSWNPHDRHWVMFWLMVVVPLAGGVLLFLAMDYADWQRHGAVTRCSAEAAMGTALRGWTVWLHFGILAVPLLGIARLLHTMATRIHRPAFVLQINVEGAILVAGSFVLAQALEALARSARTLC
ncbi:hypothetical protein LJR129_004373 [Acidovorax sp. LjRoot129]|uniref:hypothetical protein n=1 Tax=Acidovorax sp. LjRoot129 TaxID=3342260 RepID=UPI003ED1582E